MGIEDLATVAVDCGFKLHKEIGPGLVEALRERGIAVERQVPAPVQYKGVVVDNAFRMDLLVERILVIELKSTERDSALYPKQLLTYLRLLDLVNNHREFGSSHS
jgi:GxxExxY protein